MVAQITSFFLGDTISPPDAIVYHRSYTWLSFSGAVVYLWANAVSYLSPRSTSLAEGVFLRRTSLDNLWVSGVYEEVNGALIAVIECILRNGTGFPEPLGSTSFNITASSLSKEPFGKRVAGREKSLWV
ncbi:hypothetical protein DY000_02032210 [Brassica cretica]|uniref:Uncharacterized protein n=1 Tax=Brassica cretica TaxID=69181 RepID=A0ABQ7DK68_BRACR|nr:hypothetical protein DY000_02032210 [Brassica cretica]